MGWFCEERGEGRPLVLLHGIGMSHAAWAPVMDTLAAERRVLAFDIAGFGHTPPLPGPVTADALVQGLKDSLAERGIHEPVDIAGNSMGGWLTMEAAVAGLARSIVCISPAGLADHADTPAHIRPVFDLARIGARQLPGMSRRLMQMAPLRSLLLAVPMSIRSHRMPAAAAERALADFAGAPGFDATYDVITRVIGTESLTIPVTVAFGRLDWLLTARLQRRDRLPAQARWLRPWGWGHVPMWEDPIGVSRLILDGTR